jgi:hypothetical protein
MLTYAYPSMCQLCGINHETRGRSVTHVRTMAGVQWTRYSDGIWQSSLGRVLRQGRYWYFVPTEGDVQKHLTWGAAIWSARKP